MQVICKEPFYYEGVHYKPGDSVTMPKKDGQGHIDLGLAAFAGPPADKMVKGGMNKARKGVRFFGSL